MAPERIRLRRRVGPASWLLPAAWAIASASATAVGDGSATHALPGTQRSYDILLPPGDPNGRPLVVFLHAPAQPKLDRFQAEYWPVFRERGCLVALPKTSDKLMWRYGDAQYVVDVIDDVQKRYRTDPKRILLMGVSGGGQTALFLVDHDPQRFRAVIAVSTNPVVVRGRRHEWFYPSLKTAKACPYLVINHITQGAALQYWRQVRSKRQEAGASISILPVLGPAEHYQPPPKELGPWLEAVLAGKHPKPLPDPQEAAVAKLFAQCVADLPKALAAAGPAAQTQPVAKDGEIFRLALAAPADFERSKKEDKADSADRPITQVRVEHKKWPILIRCDARKTEQPMLDVLKAEEQQTRQRGILYQVYHIASVDAGKRTWPLKVGSITYPDQKRGWVSVLFLHAAAPIAKDPSHWLEVTVMDETQQPDAAELAGILKTVLAGIGAQPVQGAGSQPARAAPAPR